MALSNFFVRIRREFVVIIGHVGVALDVFGIGLDPPQIHVPGFFLQFLLVAGVAFVELCHDVVIVHVAGLEVDDPQIHLFGLVEVFQPVVHVAEGINDILVVRFEFIGLLQGGQGFCGPLHVFRVFLSGNIQVLVAFTQETVGVLHVGIVFDDLLVFDDGLAVFGVLEQLVGL